MKKLSQIIHEAFIAESVNNFFEKDKKQKERYKDQVWDILQKAYFDQGGIHGSGFRTKDDMVNNVPFWKLDIVDGEVLAVIMYKFAPNKSGIPLRKGVAMGKLFDKSRKDFISTKLINMIRDEAKRGIIEISGKAYDFYKKLLGSEFNKYLIPSSKVSEIINKDNIKILDKYKYSREIGGAFHEKYLLGTPKSKY